MKRLTGVQKAGRLLNRMLTQTLHPTKPLEPPLIDCDLKEKR